MLIQHELQLMYQEKLQNSVRLIGITISNLNTPSKKESNIKTDKMEVQLSLPF